MAEGLVNQGIEGAHSDSAPLVLDTPAGHALDFERLTLALKTAGEPTRLRLLAILSIGDLTVTELTQALGQSQPRISRHLKLLQEAGLVSRFREGSWVFYRAETAHPLIGSILDWSKQDPVLERDRVRLAQVREARNVQAAEYFRTHAAEWDHLRSLHVSEQEVEAALRAVVGTEPIDTLVDLGTGTGRMLELFGPQAKQALGLDREREMLNLARTNLDRAGLLHARVRQGDLFDLDLLDEPALTGGADLVVLHQVLHYFDDPRAALARAQALLKGEGRLLIVDFAPHGLETLRTDHAHRRLGFSEGEMHGWLESLGLTVEAVRRLDAPSALGGEAGGASGASSGALAKENGTLAILIWLARPSSARPK